MNRVNYCNDFCHNDSTINIVVAIIIIILIGIQTYHRQLETLRFSYLCTLTTWYSLPAAAADQYLPAGPTAANMQQRVC